MKIFEDKYAVQQINGDWYALEITTLFHIKIFTCCLFANGGVILSSPKSGYAKHSTREAALRAIENRKMNISESVKLSKQNSPIEWVD